MRPRRTRGSATILENTKRRRYRIKREGILGKGSE